MNRYKLGDRVRIANRTKCSEWISEELIVDFDAAKGDTGVIAKVYSPKHRPSYGINLDAPNKGQLSCWAKDLRKLKAVAG